MRDDNYIPKRYNIGRRAFSLLALTGITKIGNADDMNVYEGHVGDLYDKAKNEDALTWYMSYTGSEDADRAANLFMKMYPGIQVKVVRATAGVTYQRIQQDLAAGIKVCDVFSTSNIAHYVDLKSEGVLERYVPASSQFLHEELQHLDKDGFFHVVDMGTIGYIYNTNVMNDANVLNSWDALTDLDLKGMAAVGHPGFSAYVGHWATRMHELYGSDWFYEFAKNAPHVGRSIIDVDQTVLSGERAFGVAALQNGARMINNGSPIGMKIPKEGGILMLVPSAIMANAPNMYSAKLFTEFLVGSREYDDLRIERFSMPKRKDGVGREGASELGGKDKFIALSETAAIGEMPKVVEIWRDAFGV